MMDLQVLVATMDQEDASLIERMNIRSPAIILNQARETSHSVHDFDFGRVDFVTVPLRGVGRNRNIALQWAEANICLLADDDVVYYSDYPSVIHDAFTSFPDADVILFNLDVTETTDGRTIPTTTRTRRLGMRAAVRYSTPRLAFRRSSIQAANIHFSTLFGGGAEYASGEDTIFLADCIRKGLRIYAVPSAIGAYALTDSSWFSGFDAQYLQDRAALYSAIWGRMAPLAGAAFISKHRAKFKPDLTSTQALREYIRGYHAFKRRRMARSQ